MSHLNFSQAKWLKMFKKSGWLQQPYPEDGKAALQSETYILFLILILKSINHITFTHVNIYAFNDI